MASAHISEALAALRRGGVVGCPTETQIGLLANALDEAAVRRVVGLKGRADDQPIALLLPNADALSLVAEPLSADVLAWIGTYWPGPLTVVVSALPGLPAPLVRAGRVGARVPGPSAALELVRRFGGPLTATSANRSGEPPATTEAEVRRLFGGELDAIVPGDSPGGLPSTVVDLTVDPPKLIRPGAVALSIPRHPER